jgi:putative transposase
MQLVERHIISNSHRYFKEIDQLAFLSKNLYNRANYIIRQEFINTSNKKQIGLLKRANWIGYKQLQQHLQNDNDHDYCRLPRKVSQWVLKILDKNWVSFFASIRDYKRCQEKYKQRPSLPGYKHKTDGRNLLVYTNQAISKKHLKKGMVNPSGTGIFISTKQKIIQQVRIVPKIHGYVIEIIYDKKAENKNLDKKRIGGIDLGVNNLATVTSNVVSLKPLIVNGRLLKSINAFYNKKKATLMSYVGNRKTATSRRIRKLIHKRNCKVDDALHKSSRAIINRLVEYNIGTLVIGLNPAWKQNINLNAITNQNFVSIPHKRFIDMLMYKAALVGLDVVIQEEAHTSKCSFIDMEDVCHQESYAGKRIKRGLFRSKDGMIINADCNGSGNIIRKAFPHAFAEGIQGVVVRPVRITPYQKVASATLNYEPVIETKTVK